MTGSSSLAPQLERMTKADNPRLTAVRVTVKSALGASQDLGRDSPGLMPSVHEVRNALQYPLVVAPFTIPLAAVALVTVALAAVALAGLSLV